LTKLAKNGRAAHVLKPTAARRKTKAELIEAKQKDEEAKNNITECRSIRDFLSSKRYKMEDIPGVISKGEQLVDYLKTKGIMNPEGQMNV